MIKIQNIIDFIASKRPQYKMENWINIKSKDLREIPTKNENGELLGYYNDNNKKEGYWEEYFHDGKIYSKGHYVNGKQHGYWEQYYVNGKLESKGNYKNNLKDGYWEFYWRDGKLEKTGQYIDGDFYEE